MARLVIRGDGKACCKGFEPLNSIRRRAEDKQPVWVGFGGGSRK